MCDLERFSQIQSHINNKIKQKIVVAPHTLHTQSYIIVTQNVLKSSLVSYSQVFRIKNLLDMLDLNYRPNITYKAWQNRRGTMLSTKLLMVSNRLYRTLRQEYVQD